MHSNRDASFLEAGSLGACCGPKRISHEWSTENANCTRQTHGDLSGLHALYILSNQKSLYKKISEREFCIP